MALLIVADAPYTGIITDKTTGESFASKPFPEFIKNIMANGGLVGYTESELKD